jgi:CBS domain-containing protein
MAAGARIPPRPIRDVLQTDVVTVRQDEGIPSAVEKMAEADVGSVVVVENGQPTGILTDRKIALSLRETTDVSGVTVADLVGEDLITASTDTNAYAVLGTLEEHSIRRVPVVDENGSLAGIVTLDDLLVLLSDELSAAANVIEAQSSRL